MTSIDTDGPAERSLEEAAMRGDRRAIQALWQHHRRWVAAVLIAYKPRSEDLEDLLQDVAMTMLTKINTVREAGNVRAWLRTVAINTARAAGRSERAKPVQRLHADVCDGGGGVSAASAKSASGMAGDNGTVGLRHGGRPSGIAAYETNDEARRVMRLAEDLPEGYREPLLLKAVHGLRSRQISEILGIPEATVDTRVSRARRMLRELTYAGETGDENPASGEGAVAASLSLSRKS